MSDVYLSLIIFSETFEPDVLFCISVEVRTKLFITVYFQVQSSAGLEFPFTRATKMAVLKHGS